MTEKLQQTIKEEVGRLPKEMQEVINVIDWLKISEEIGKKYLLEEGEIEDFQLETLLVLIGVEGPTSYAINIENQVGTTKDEAVKMAKEAFEKIFLPIGNALEENIKKNLKNIKPNAEQNLGFIMSGGNYSSFLAPTQENSSTPSDKPATPQEGNNTPPVKPPTLQDIKNKLAV